MIATGQCMRFGCEQALLGSRQGLPIWLQPGHAGTGDREPTCVVGHATCEGTAMGRGL